MSTDAILTAVELLFHNADDEQFEHAVSVARWFTARGQEHRCAVALLHDVLEEGITSESRVEELFSPGILRDVKAVTRMDGESYADYITELRAKGTDAAIEVKIADLKTNLSRPEPKGTLAKRYERALKFLTYRTDEF